MSAQTAAALRTEVTTARNRHGKTAQQNAAITIAFDPAYGYGYDTLTVADGP